MEPVREIVGEAASEGVLSWDAARQIGCVHLSGRVAVEEIAHCLVEMASTVFCDCQQCRRLALWETVGRGN